MHIARISRKFENVCYYIKGNRRLPHYMRTIFFSFQSGQIWTPLQRAHPKYTKVVWFVSSSSSHSLSLMPHITKLFARAHPHGWFLRWDHKTQCISIYMIASYIIKPIWQTTKTIKSPFLIPSSHIESFERKFETINNTVLLPMYLCIYVSMYLTWLLGSYVANCSLHYLPTLLTAQDD